MVVCPKTGLVTGPQWFPELQWYVEEETSSRKEQILPREEEPPWMEEKAPQGKNKSSQEKMKPPQEGRHPFPASFHNIPLEILLLREEQYGPFWFSTCDQTSFTEKKSIAQVRYININKYTIVHQKEQDELCALKIKTHQLTLIELFK